MTKPVPILDIDFYSDEVIEDPYPVYAELRRLGPVVYLPQNKLYALPRYDEVSYVLREPLRFPSSRGVSPIDKVNQLIIGSTLNSDPPEHDESRAVTATPLLPGALSVVEPRIRAAADGLIATLCERRAFDAISDLSQYLPLTIVAELVGLPDAGRANMLKWASATFNLFGTENQRTETAFSQLKEMREFLDEYGKPEQLKPGGWARRIFEVGPERGLSKDKCTEIIRDYIAPSLDTTISATGQLIKLFADNPDQWDLLRQRPELVDNAIEEAVRLATPIRAFTRYVNEDSDFGGVTVPEGERVIVIYASANRDERKYTHPDAFDITRDVHDHLGFGQGVHMCMGMHLARLEIKALLEALVPRVKRFVVEGQPTIAMNNTIRAFTSLPVHVELDDHCAAVTPSESPDAKTLDWLNLVVSARIDVATDIIALELRAPDGATLPPYEAGAHVDVLIRDGLVRQYSLTGDGRDPSTWRLGILNDADSRGGSATVHGRLNIGEKIRVGKPRNHFPLSQNAQHSILVAGGIGITPLLAMAHTLDRSHRQFELHYCCRSRDRVAFAPDLEQFGDRIHIYVDDGPESQRFDAERLLATPDADKHLYVCGPNGFMDVVTETAQRLNWQPDRLHVERFGNEVDTDGAPFTVVARLSGKTFDVLPGETIAEKLRANEIAVNMSCQSGVCGTCLTAVLEGKPDHRDLVQTDHEKASNTQITVCCSRSTSRTLVLDI